MKQKQAYLPFIAIFVALLPCINVAYETKIIDLPGSRNQLKLPTVVGPESIDFDPSGHGPYTGVSSGGVLKWQGRRGWTVFAYNSMHRDKDCVDNIDEMMESKCGRPLGLRFHNATGNLYIADAYHGLLSVGPKGGMVKVLATKARGVPFTFLNGLDVDQETGEVYFTDSSNHITRSEYYMVVLTNDTTGRLLKYNPRSKKVRVLKGHLSYPNGIAMSHDNSHLLVSFTALCQIHKFWIRGPKTGKFELFADLPGYPDNITRDPKGGYWVAMSNLKIDNPDGAAPEHAVALRLNQKGKIVAALNGSLTTSISEVHERDGSLWIGSLINPYVGLYRA
ncbi:Strictosidine synthase [Rhynchospora pubera]|uniref:Strictosidine synthase n=1 Tax=Rhynchospora pubera TaxID=906938 RepID=A0AAV8H5I6_9POAL|nr:Strictosidine synthase [Rhynchospora pubera]